MLIDFSNFVLTCSQGNFTLFIVVFSILLAIPTGPNCEENLPNCIDCRSHPQHRSELVTRLAFLVIQSDADFPVFQDMTVKEMSPANVVLVGIGIIDSLVEAPIRVSVIGW